jgi:DNA-binding CsgD family transcriptional regulator
MQPRDRLTPKELIVAGLVWQGLTNREIAHSLSTTEQVVKNYLRSTFDKLELWSRLELALYVAAQGSKLEGNVASAWPDADRCRASRCRVSTRNVGPRRLSLVFGTDFPQK